MSIRPVDMQILLPKASEISKNYHTLSEDGKMSAQQAFKNEMDKLTEHTMTEINQSDKSGETIDKDGTNRENDRREKQKKRQKEEKEEKSKQDATKYSNSMFDIRI